MTMGIPEHNLDQLRDVLRPSINWVNDADLPAIFTVKEVPGVFFINIAKWFDFATGILTEEITPEEGNGGIPSNPPSGGREVKNIFVASNGTLQVDYEDGL